MGGPDLGADLVDMFERSVARGGDRPFLRQKVGGAWQALSWRETALRVQLAARALRDAGLEPGDRVLLVAENRPEWCIADLAILQAGGVTVPAYTTSTADDYAYLIEHSGARLAIVSGKPFGQRVAQAIGRSDGVRVVIWLDQGERREIGGRREITWADALTQAAALPEMPSRRLGKNALACLIYTSGTGGRPKGVMLSHGNLMANIEGAWHLLEEIGLGDDRFLSFLPLSHAYEHTAGQFLPIAMGAEIWYAESIETVRSNLVEAQPTIVACVPRLYEVMRQRIQGEVDRKGGLTKRLLDRAVLLGRKRWEGRPLSLLERLQDRVLERLVRDKIRARFGGRLKALVSGGAPLNYDVGMFFLALGLPILQGYGQTEASPVVSVNPPKRPRLETVGPPLQGVQVKIAPDGEILLRGALVMQGYWRDPDATLQALQDGWLHTGDVGAIDPDGYLRITDRKKDIIVNSGGDNVAPQKVEGVLLLRPEIGQVAVFGDKKPFLVALIVPHADWAKTYAQAHGLDPSLATLCRHPGFRETIGAAVAAANASLSAIERIRSFELVDEPFSVDNGLMTPTLKIRRGEVAKRFTAEIERLYGPRGERSAA